jgi:putative transposase
VAVSGQFLVAADTRERAEQAGKAKNERTGVPKLVEGALVQGWRTALGELALTYPDRFNPYL